MKNIEESLYQSIKEKMKTLRKSHKKTQLQVAKALDVTVQHYQQVESGSTPPNLRILSGMSEIFNVHPSYFFTTSNISVIDKDGKIVIEDLDLDVVVALQSVSELPPEAKKSIIEYIRFKAFESQGKG